MDSQHPLDRPVWNALTSRQAHLAQGDRARALRFDPDYGLFAASRDLGDLSGLAGLIPDGGIVALSEAQAIAPPPGTALVM